MLMENEKIPIVIDKQVIVKQGESRFLQTTFKAPPASTIAVAKDDITNEIANLKALQARVIIDRKTFDDDLASKISNYEAMLTEF